MMSRPPQDSPSGLERAGDLPAEAAEENIEEEWEDAPDSGAEFDLAADLAEATPGSLLRGVQVIRAHLRDAPLGPGVYRMIGADGEVLYVGKAKSSADASRAMRGSPAIPTASPG